VSHRAADAEDGTWIIARFRRRKARTLKASLIARQPLAGRYPARPARVAAEFGELVQPTGRLMSDGSDMSLER
jgi:hypothetical protein